MKLKPYIFSLFLLLLTNKAISQDTLYVKGKVLSIDSMKFYSVLKILTCDSTQKTKVIFSKRDLKFEPGLDYQEIKVNDIFSFKLIGVFIFKGDDGENIILNLRSYAYADIFSLEAGEVPYLALNMSGIKIFTYSRSH
jgi:hypothetical protein